MAVTRALFLAKAAEAGLQHVHVERVRLLTNNPRKTTALVELGFDVTERIPLRTGENPHNARYLATKAGKLGHLMRD